MRRIAFALLLLAAACSRETPAPPETTSSAPPQTSTTASTATQAPPQQRSYGKAMDWFRSTHGFHFVIDLDGAHAEGDLVRSAIGAERARIALKDGTWIAAAKPEGLVWYREESGTRARAAAPNGADRLWQRVTVAFDPQKKEGDAQLDGDRFRFTDANTGNTHEVWVNDRNQIERMTIDGSTKMDLKITQPDKPANVPEV